MAIVRDPAGGQFGLWQGRRHIGCERVNEPNTLVRNDLVTDQPAVTRPFYAEVFGFTLDGNPDLPDFDFTFLRRPDGHEIGGIMGVPSGAGTSWSTTFEVDDTDAALARAVAAGGTVGPVDDMIYGRLARSPTRSEPSSRSSPGRPDVLDGRRRRPRRPGGGAGGCCWVSRPRSRSVSG